MKIRSLGLLLACACLLPSPLAQAHQAEADFNDLFLGNTRTSGGTSSEPNFNNVNTGTGFASGGNGEYNNNTGVVLFEKGDLAVPAGVMNFISDQAAPVDPLAASAPSGVFFGSSSGSFFSRFQERAFAQPFTGNHIWFSYLFRLTGPDARGQLTFNQPATTTSDPDDGSAPPGAFGISMGHPDAEGAIAINLNPLENPSHLLAGNDPNLVYYDSVGGSGDYNGNGQIDGVDVGLGNAANVKSHLIIGRITFNSAGDEIIEVWLDPANARDPASSPPTLTATGDEIPAEGITSIAFRGTRTSAPVLESGAYTSGGHFALDHFRISDEADALDYVTGNVQVDPKLVIHPDSEDTNFNFQGVYGTGSPITAAAKTVTLHNAGATKNITINTIAFQNTAETATAPFVIEEQPPAGFVLAPNQSVEIKMHASSEIFETGFFNNLVISTDHPDQDMGLSVAATFYRSESRINANSSLNSNIDGWLSDAYTGDNTPPPVVAPGFIGSPGMVFLRGAGQTGGSDNLSQTMLNGAKDWELTFFFSPLDVSQMEAKIGRAPQADDRSFQLVIQSDNEAPVPASGTLGTFTDLHNGDAAMINIAYMPAGGGASNVPGFYVFNGNNWQLINLPAIEGSIDEGSDGILNANLQAPAVPDTVRSYLMRIKGTGFGTAQAKYSVSISQPNSTLTAATASDLAVWSSTSGQLNTPGGYTFTTGDISESGGGSTARTSFWFDEVSFFAVEARDPDFSLAANQIIYSHNGVTASGSISLTNTGFNNPLEITTIASTNSAFSSPQVLPLMVPAGTTVQIPVNVISGLTSGNTAARATFNFTGNVPLAPTRSVTAFVTATTTSNLVANWNFEVLGNETGGDNDSFAIWDEKPNQTSSKDVQGFGDPPGIAAYLGRNTGISSPFGIPTGDFVLEYDFAFKDAGDSQRSFSMRLNGASGFAMTLFYRAGSWFVAEGEGDMEVLGNAFLNPSADGNVDFDLNDAGDSKSVYKMPFTANAWNTAEPRYQFDILDSTGTVVASSPPLTRSASVDPVGASSILFQSADVAEAGFWVDNIKAGAIVESAVPITGFSKTAGGFTISWDNGGNNIILERSTTLLTGSWEILPLSPTDISAGTYNDTTAPADHAFYRIRRP